MKKKIILICDTKNEIDDQFAIVYALKSPELELLGVVSTQNNRRNGRNSVELYHREAQKILSLSGSKIPALKGASRPLFRLPEKSEGARFIVDQIKKSRSAIYIVSTGPATDLVNALKLEPKIINKAKFIWLGGFKYSWMKIFLHRETNFAGDIVAARELMKLKKNLLIVPTLGVSHTLVANTNKLQKKLSENNQPLDRYLGQLINWNRQRFGFRRWFLKPLRNLWIFSDLAAVAAVLGGDLVQTDSSSSAVKKIYAKKILQDFSRKVLE